MKKQTILALGLLLGFLSFETFASAQIAVKNNSTNDADVNITGLTPNQSHTIAYDNQTSSFTIQTNACGFGRTSMNDRFGSPLNNFVVGTVAYDTEVVSTAPLVEYPSCVNGVVTYGEGIPNNQKINAGSNATKKLFKTDSGSGAVVIGNLSPFTVYTLTNPAVKGARTARSNACGMINLRRDAKWNNNTTLNVRTIDVTSGDELIIGSAAFSAG
jgi:hypothetical protein